VSCLSWAMASAIALVASISAAWMRRCLLPQPNRTMLPSVMRLYGMPRATAASTMQRVLGPKRTSSSNARKRDSASCRSKSVRCRADSTQCMGQLQCQPANGLFAVLHHHLVDLGIHRGRGATERDWAATLCLQAQGAQLQHACHRDAVGVALRLQGAERRKALRSRASRPGTRSMASSSSLQVTTAWMAVWWLQRLGPRNARIRVTSMGVLLSTGVVSGWNQRYAGRR